jgi:hypothetical protein
MPDSTGIQPHRTTHQEFSSMDIPLYMILQEYRPTKLQSKNLILHEYCPHRTPIQEFSSSGIHPYRIVVQKFSSTGIQT